MVQHFFFLKKKKKIKLHYHCFFFPQFSPRTDWCRTSRQHIVSSCHFASSTPFQGCDPRSAEARPAFTHESSRTMTVTDIRVESCNPQIPHFTYKNKTRRLPHKQRAHPTVPTWQFCIGRCFSKSVITAQGSNTAFRLIFCVFFEELSPAGGRVVGRSFRVVLPPLLFCWVVLLSSAFLGWRRRSLFHMKGH